MKYIILIFLFGCGGTPPVQVIKHSDCWMFLDDKENGWVRCDEWEEVPRDPSPYGDIPIIEDE